MTQIKKWVAGVLAAGMVANCLGVPAYADELEVRKVASKGSASESAAASVASETTPKAATTNIANGTDTAAATDTANEIDITAATDIANGTDTAAVTDTANGTDTTATTNTANGTDTAAATDIANGTNTATAPDTEATDTAATKDPASDMPQGSQASMRVGGAGILELNDADDDITTLEVARLVLADSLLTIDQSDRISYNRTRAYCEDEIGSVYSNGYETYTGYTISSEDVLPSETLNRWMSGAALTISGTNTAGRAYLEQFRFLLQDGNLYVSAAPTVPDGTYQFLKSPQKQQTKQQQQSDAGESFEPVEFAVRVKSAKLTPSLSKDMIYLNTIYAKSQTLTIKVNDADFRAIYPNVTYRFGEADDTDFDANEAAVATKNSLVVKAKPEGISSAEALSMVQIGYSFRDDEAGGHEVDGYLITVQSLKNLKQGTYEFGIKPAFYLRDEDNDISTLFPMKEVSFRVTIEEVMPTASLSQSAVTIGNRDLDAVTQIRWKVSSDTQNGNENTTSGSDKNAEDNAGAAAHGGSLTTAEQYMPKLLIPEGSDSDYAQRAPKVTMQADGTLGVSATASTRAGTYRYKVTPVFVPETDQTVQIPLDSTTLTVYVTDDRPAVTAQRSVVTAYQHITVDPDKSSEEVAVTRTKLETTTKEPLRITKIVPADRRTKEVKQLLATDKALKNESGVAGETTLAGDTLIATADATVPKGDYSYLVYTCLAGDGAAAADDFHGAGVLEPVKIKVHVDDRTFEDMVQIENTTATIYSMFGESSDRIELEDPAGLIKQVEPQTWYLVKKGLLWKLEQQTTDEGDETVPGFEQSGASSDLKNAYAIVTVNADGTIVVTAGEKINKLSKTTTVRARDFAMNVTLQGDRGSYTWKPVFNIKMGRGLPKPSLSVAGGTVKCNVNYDFTAVKQTDVTTGYQKIARDVLRLGTEGDYPISRVAIVQDQKAESRGLYLRARDPQDGKVTFDLLSNGKYREQKGTYRYLLTPYIEDQDGEEKQLSPISVKLVVTQETATTYVDNNKVTINQLDTRPESYVKIHFDMSQQNAAIIGSKVELVGRPGEIPPFIAVSADDLLIKGKDGRYVTDNVLTVGASEGTVNLWTGEYGIEVTTWTVEEDGKPVDPCTNRIYITLEAVAEYLTASLDTDRIYIDPADSSTYEKTIGVTVQGKDLDKLESIRWNMYLMDAPENGASDAFTLDQTKNGLQLTFRGGLDYMEPGTYQFSLVAEEVKSSIEESVHRVENLPSFEVVVAKDNRPFIKSFALTTDKLEQTIGTTCQLELKDVLPQVHNSAPLLYESSNPELASVDAKGVVSFDNPGMTVVTVYTGDKSFKQQCLVIVRGKNDVYPDEPYVTPQQFRKISDVDDTEAFNRAIESLGGETGTVYVPEGTYRIDALAGIGLVSNMKLVMSPEARLVAKGNNATGYNIIRLNHISNTTITGGNIIGERYEHSGNNGEWGMGIGIYDCHDITIRSVNITNCYGDGIYIGSGIDAEDYNGNDPYYAYSYNITILDSYVQNNRRNNLSITAGKNVTIDNCEFWNANGTDPESGIDVETNYSSRPCNGITVRNCILSGNMDYAFLIASEAYDITLDHCTMNGDVNVYYGINVKFIACRIRGKVYSRTGIEMDEKTEINDGGEAPDTLVAEFSAQKGNLKANQWGGYKNINHQPQFTAPGSITNVSIEDVTYGSGENQVQAIRFQRIEDGGPEAGYYIDLDKISLEGDKKLNAGDRYRIEYSVRGTGDWGYNSDQTGWYPITPGSDETFATSMVTYTADQIWNGICRVYFYVLNTVGSFVNSFLELVSLKIYKVN